MIKLYLSICARRKIETAVLDAKRSKEVGGLLLGHIHKGVAYIVDTAIPPSNAQNSNTTFVLNGRIASELAQRIANHYKIKCKIIGVWHSHICTDATMSQQDQKASWELSRALGGRALSMIVFGMNAQDMEMRVYHFGKNSIKPIQIERTDSIPTQYITRR